MRTTVSAQADHFQVLIGDRVRAPEIDTTDLWATSASIPSIADEPWLIALPVVRFGGTVSIAVVVAESESGDLETEWTSIGPFVLEVPSGTLQLWAPECEDLETGVLSIDVPPGRYRGEAFESGRELVGDEFDLTGPDRYRVVLVAVAAPD